MRERERERETERESEREREREREIETERDRERERELPDLRAGRNRDHISALRSPEPWTAKAPNPNYTKPKKGLCAAVKVENRSYCIAISCH